MSHYKFLLALGFCMINLCVIAQHKVYKQFTSKDGLPSNTIYDIEQDVRGYMWFATDNGLSRFDGTEFVTFSLSHGLPDNEILKMFKDSQERIWVLGFNGEVGYLENEKFYNSKNSEVLKNLSFTNNIDNVYEDSQRSIWFYGRNTELKCLTFEGEVYETKEKQSNLFPMTFIEDKESGIYLITSFSKNQALELGVKNNVISTRRISYDSVTSLVKTEDVFSHLGRDGFYNPKDSVGMKLYNFGKKNLPGFNSFWPPKKISLPNNKFWLISNFTGLHLVSDTNKGIKIDYSEKDFASCTYYKDREGNEWIGSVNKGILFFPKTSVEQISLDEEDLFGVFISRDSILYTGSYEGDLFEFKENKLIKTYQNNRLKFSKTNPNKIIEILPYKNHLILINNNDLRIYNRKKGLLTGKFAVLTLASGKDGYIHGDILYLATSNTIYEIDLKRFIEVANWSFSDKIDFIQPGDQFGDNFYKRTIWKKRGSAVFVDQKNRLWIGTNKGLFYREKDKIISFKSAPGFDKFNITDINETSEGIITVATNGFGLGAIESDTSYFISELVTEKNPVINKVKLDDSGTIWLATNVGVFGGKIDNRSFQPIQKFTPLEGLSSKNIRNIAFHGDKVFVTSSKGLNCISRIKKENKAISQVPVYITEVTVNELPDDSLKMRKLKHYQNDVYFGFTGLSFKSLDKLKYKYRLKPWENKWITTETRGVRYSNLPADSYTFEVKAVDKDGNETQNPTLYMFNINEAWYKTRWFLTSLILIGVLIIWGLVSGRINSVRQRGIYNEKIAILKHQALLTQMNPHFIYNTLSSVQHFVLNNDTDNAQKQLTKFGELIRTILTNSKKTSIPLSEEVKLLKNYLELEKVRFHDSFNYEMRMEAADSFDIEIPPMIIQPIIENAIIHGITPLKDRKGFVDILFMEKGDQLICIVTDNGIGIKKSETLKQRSILHTDHIALNNIRERLNLFGKGNFSNNLLIEELKDNNGKVTGTRVTVIIPTGEEHD